MMGCCWMLISLFYVPVPAVCVYMGFLSWYLLLIDCVSAMAMRVLADWVIELCVKCRDVGWVEPLFYV
jgi:hypothetical protein